MRLHHAEHVAHDVIVENAVEHPHVRGGGGVGGKQRAALRPGGRQIFNDASRFEYGLLAIKQQREFAGGRPLLHDRLVLCMFGPEHAEGERQRASVKRDQRLPRVGRKRVAEELQNRETPFGGLPLYSLVGQEGGNSTGGPEVFQAPSSARRRRRKRRSGSCRARSSARV